MDGISITIVFELTNNASIGISIRASVAIMTSAVAHSATAIWCGHGCLPSTTEGWSASPVRRQSLTIRIAYCICTRCYAGAHTSG